MQDVPHADARQYGIVSATAYQPALERVNGIIEKPDPDAAPSTLAVVGRYVLSNPIFECLENIGKGAGGEIQLADGIAALMQRKAVLAYRYNGQRFDCGSKLGYFTATLEMGLQHPETGPALAEYLSARQ